MKSLQIKEFKMALANNKIEHFWGWFKSIAENIEENILMSEFTSELEERISGIADIDWEIGPGVHSKWLFVLSPKGDRDLLKITKKIIICAPKIDEWEFYYAKPAKRWNLIFYIKYKDNDVLVDGSTWEYKLFEFPDGTFDIVFRPNNASNLSENDLWLAACIIVDGEIGEERRIEFIKNIEIVSDWDDGTSQKGNHLKLGVLNKLIPDLSVRK